jgi:transposase
MLYIQLKIPPYGPDINIIENIWASMKKYVRKESCSKDEEIKTRIVDFFDNKLECKLFYIILLEKKVIGLICKLTWFRWYS